MLTYAMRLVLVAVACDALRAPLLRPHASSMRTTASLRAKPLRAAAAADAPGRRVRFAQLFPLWTVAAATLGVTQPALVEPLTTPAAFRNGLALLMLSMGATLTPADLRAAATKKKALAVNLASCFFIAPLAALAASALLHVDAATRAGLVLLGCVSGGQASNLCALLAGGDVALSVVLTTSTTLAGVVLTPCLASTLLATTVAVEAGAILRSTASLVLAPLATGLVFARAAPALAARVVPWCAPAGVLATTGLVCGGAANAARVLVGAGAWRAHAGVVVLALASAGLAYCASRAAGLGEREGRTVAIETLVKSPTLAFVLARTHLGEPAAGVAAAAMIWLAILGAAVASMWGRMAARPTSAVAAGPPARWSWSGPVVP